MMTNHDVPGLPVLSLSRLILILIVYLLFPFCEGASVTVDIGKTPISTSSYKTGVSLIDNDISPSSSNPTCVSNVKALIRNNNSSNGGGGIGYLNSFIQAWGMGDVWPQPPPVQTDVDPREWQMMDYRMNISLNSAITPIISLCEAPWWMKGQLQKDGSTVLLTEGQEWDDIAYSSRVLDNKMNYWLLIVQRTAERYMAPPWNVRYFQVWNEFKGYYNPITNAWDYNNSSGDPSGNNAKHGYTFMYNQVYNRLLQVATKLGVSGELRVGGPYAPMDSWASEGPRGAVSGPYGYVDKRALDGVSFWLAHKVDGQFVTMDGGNSNKDKNIADDFQRSLMFRDIAMWVRTQQGGTTIPIVWAEYYINTDKPYSDARNNALKVYSIIETLPFNLGTAMLWGGTGDGEADTAGLWTPCTSSQGGKPTMFFTSSSWIHKYFGQGISIYGTSVSDATMVGALASRSTLMLVNTQNSQTQVLVQGGKLTITLAPYEVGIYNITW
eukprot:TRINITY_DN2051_c0_g1_i2.p1 TRINITY_DN2051_c0_g1~~TRINITY_DN2051_c0_g1_i2.p1  ORF type:complete len:496 (-),score=110.28 TRINITY_DN2051_c0_g1_i2:122-1609(-)